MNSGISFTRFLYRKGRQYPRVLASLLFLFCLAAGAMIVAVLFYALSGLSYLNLKLAALLSTHEMSMYRVDGSFPIILIAAFILALVGFGVVYAVLDPGHRDLKID